MEEMDVISLKLSNGNSPNLQKANQFPYFLQGSQGDGLAVGEFIQGVHEFG
jgi:hypothetical protein